jgi:mannosyltransferase OCH1-like enzyme
MRIGLNVGLSTASYSMRSILVTNEERLEASGWAVADEGHDRLERNYQSTLRIRAAEQTIGAWSDWLPTCRADGALLSCSHLADALLVGGQARELTATIRQRGELSCGALVRRFDDYNATRYVLDLLQGRWRPITERELAGRGLNNYLARLAKWQEAAGSDFFAIPCPPDRPETNELLAMLEKFGVPQVKTLQLPEPNRAKQLDRHGVEVLRRFNRLLNLNGIEGRQANEVRAAAVAKLPLPAPRTYFRIPAESARKLLRTFQEPATELARAMSAEDRQRYLDQDVPPDEPLDDAQVVSTLRRIADELDIKTGAKVQRSVAEAALYDVRRFARKAQAAKREGNALKYRRSTKRVRQSIPEVPDYRIHGLREDSELIPRRVVQFWDPAPPPEEMLPWLNSWKTVGLPGGYHEVADYQQGLEAVQEVAGEQGRQAYESATHAAVRSDLYRYAELHMRGGWYIDAEHEALLPMPDIIQWPVEHVLGVRPGKERVVNNFIGAAAGSELMKSALLKGCENLLSKSSNSVMQLTGPHMFSDCVRAYTKSSQASYVILPTNIVFGGVLQDVHNQAEYKIHGHWRYTELSD